MRHLVVKELNELLREKRFPVFMTTLASALGAFGMILLSQSARSAEHGHAWSYSQPLAALVFVGLISCTLLALTFAADIVAKERDQGMLPMLLTSPVTHADLLSAKLVTLLVVYASFAVVNLAVASLLALAFGFVLVKAMFWLLVGPLGTFYVFYAGLCVFLSTAFRTSKAALAVGVSVILPLFLLMKQAPFGFLLREPAPRVYEALSWLPIEATVDAALAIGQGGAFDWGPPLFGAFLGAAFIVVSYFTFQLREAGA